MTSSLPFELCFFALWGVLVFAYGVMFGLWLAEQNTPGDGDSTSGKSTTEEPK